MLPIGEIGKVVTGKTPSTAVDHYYGGEYPFYTPSDMDGRKRLESTKRSLSTEGIDSIRGSIIEAGAVMVSCIGSDMGKVAIAANKGATNQQINTILVSQGFDPEYIYYELSTRKDELQMLATGGSAQPILNKGHFCQIEICVPPLPEQKAIAHILGTLDDKIELNRKTNETLEAMAKALFKSWFVDFDPVRAKAEGRPTGLPAEISDLFPDSFEDSELGEIPIGWRVMELGMVSTFLNGYAFKSSDWQEHGVPVVKIGSVKPGFVDVDNVSFVSDEIAVSKERYRLSPGDILIGMTGYVGEVGLVPFSESPPLLNQRVGRVAPMSDAIVSRSFLYNWMRTSTFKDSVEVLSHGSAQANVSSDSIQSIPHAIPSSDIERAFASICEPMLDRLLEGHREQKLLANIRDALLPKLISGEIRIPDAEKMLEEVGV
jgi:type I restriction enzyme S subunit